ncbi:hypothetical protein LPB136_07905 [Tenacibaculum todarodis]|uniref:Uncharacterized protein n=1 Tax=Tenacibaculum todarodis TaxID=1850252 RepID=A0A1L3JJJ1_9FLAO|nr:hypothetical protein [Tenacibaculum todarodis]APG65277.1 hypothetical protein LPB136_07905 [Tenacibaculum todarodis]
MDTNFNQLQIEYLGTKKVSSFFKLISICLILIFAFVPLAEFINGLDYHYIESYPVRSCIVGWENYYQPKPLQFNSLPPIK